MTEIKYTQVCRVCGYYDPDYLEYFPWGENGCVPSYDICECCGVEFGYEDWILESIRHYRAEWLAGGTKWFVPKSKPEDWNLEEQLKQIPPQFL